MQNNTIIATHKKSTKDYIDLAKKLLGHHQSVNIIASGGFINKVITACDTLIKDGFAEYQAIKTDTVKGIS